MFEITAETPYEVTRTHMVEVSGEIRPCLRPESVRSMAKAVRRWAETPGKCDTCFAQAVSLCSGLPLCSVCRGKRAMEVFDIDISKGRLSRRGLEDSEGARFGLHGHPIVFEKFSVDLGGFVERMMPSSVHRLLGQATDLRALWNHSSDSVLGRVTAGTLAVRKDAVGLACHILPPRWADQHVESIQRRDITGMSFAFAAVDDDWYMEGEKVVRDVYDMVVSEISPVTFPAYPDTDISTEQTFRGSRLEWLQRKNKTLLAK